MSTSLVSRVLRSRFGEPVIEIQERDVCQSKGTWMKNVTTRCLIQEGGRSQPSGWLLPWKHDGEKWARRGRGGGGAFRLITAVSDFKSVRAESYEKENRPWRNSSTRGITRQENERIFAHARKLKVSAPTSPPSSPFFSPKELDTYASFARRAGGKKKGTVDDYQASIYLHKWCPAVYEEWGFCLYYKAQV
jgi:hypothetical protein